MTTTTTTMRMILRLLFAFFFFRHVAASTGGTMTVLVPAYANPCPCGGNNPDGVEMWEKLIAAAPNYAIHIILNPASGPGADSTIDPNYISSDGTSGPLLDFTAAGGTAYGYVSTVYGTRDMEDVKTDVDKYFSSSYYQNNNVQVSGIFFDEMSSADDSDLIEYYQQLYDYVKSIAADAKVITNPGVADLPAGYAAVADTIVTFEQTGSFYRDPSYIHQPSWADEYSAEKFAHLVHSEEFANLATDISLAQERGVGMLYITDDVMNNPWDKLPTYWDDLLTAIDSLDSDGDGILDAVDLCPDTVIPDTIPTLWLGRNRWALGSDGTFRSGKRASAEHGFTLEDTGGCSGEQIIEQMNLGSGHRKFGISTGAMEEWVEFVSVHQP